MITISTCMIVKNEERVLARCLDCVKEFSDEIILVDTGSTDSTKDIAAQYTDKIYDFPWINDFAAARNYSFSKAAMEYIYIADADEVIDRENIEKIKALKSILLPEIEIVQMYYTNQLEYGSTYNFDQEYRPKLVKRLREFVWQDPLHETLRTTPVIFDSDIAIIHKPHESHARRDFANLQGILAKGKPLSKNLTLMYAKELFIAGAKQDFLEAKTYFTTLIADSTQEDLFQAALCVLARCAQLEDNPHDLLNCALKLTAGGLSTSELCTCLGDYYLQHEDFANASLWYYNACYETEAVLSITYDAQLPLQGLITCAKALDDQSMALHYQEELESLPYTSSKCM